MTNLTQPTIEDTLALIGLDGDNVTEDYARWLHVRLLDDAMDILNQRGNEAGKADALSWIIGDSTDVFSFAAVAEHLDVEPAILRKRILALPAVQTAINVVRAWLDTEKGHMAEFAATAERAHQIRLVELAKAGTLTPEMANRRRTATPKMPDATRDVADTIAVTESREGDETVNNTDALVQSIAIAAVGALQPIVEKAQRIGEPQGDATEQAVLVIARDRVIAEYNRIGKVYWEHLAGVKGDAWLSRRLWCPFADPGKTDWLGVCDEMRLTLSDLDALAAGPPFVPLF